MMEWSQLIIYQTLIIISNLRFVHYILLLVDSWHCFADDCQCLLQQT